MMIQPSPSEEEPAYTVRDLARDLTLGHPGVPPGRAARIPGSAVACASGRVAGVHHRLARQQPPAKSAPRSGGANRATRPRTGKVGWLPSPLGRGPVVQGSDEGVRGRGARRDLACFAAKFTRKEASDSIVAGVEEGEMRWLAGWVGLGFVSANPGSSRRRRLRLQRPSSIFRPPF